MLIRKLGQLLKISVKYSRRWLLVSFKIFKIWVLISQELKDLFD